MTIDHLRSLRHQLHRLAEPSGDEQRTARAVADELERLSCGNVTKGVGGHGVLAEIASPKDGPTVLLRADLDALPLDDDPALSYASERGGVAHRCGHDGHMTMALGVARAFATEPPARGRVVFGFQPAEETGAGARALIEDERFRPFTPDVVLATHNLPGYELGHVVLRDGIFASASRGLCVRLVGRSSHASEPAAGKSPVQAAASLAQALAAMPQDATALEEGAQLTIVGLLVGGARYGTSPGVARVMATLRSHHESTMDRLAERAVALARGLAAAHGLEVEIGWTDEFPATPTDSRVVDRLERVALGLGRTVERPADPFPWSEDFGHFSSRWPGALFGLGSGVDQPRLHTEGFDFPDALLEPGAEYLTACVRSLLEADLP
ncbi:MAG: amidohydrolase [Planctomycetota bacterium]